MVLFSRQVGRCLGLLVSCVLCPTFVRAQSTLYHIEGADVLTDVASQTIADARGKQIPGSFSLVFDGVGGRVAESQMLAAGPAGALGAQSIGPMDRNFTSLALGPHAAWSPSIRNVIGLDAISLVVRSGGARCANLTLPLRADDFSRAAPNDPNTPFNFGQSGSGYTQILGILLGGVDGSGSAAACASARRVQALFDLATCNSGANITHIFREDDNSGSAELLRDKLGIQRFCNGSAPGVLGSNASNLNLNNQDLDPIRRPCAVSQVFQTQSTCTDTATGAPCNSSSSTCTQGLVVALSTPDPGFSSVTLSIANRVALDPTAQTMGLAGRPAVRLQSAQTASVAINTNPPTDALVRSGSYLLSRRLFLQYGSDINDRAATALASGSGAAQVTAEFNLYQYMTDPNGSVSPDGAPGRCNVDPLLIRYGFVTCTTDCTPPSGASNLCASTPFPITAAAPSACVPASGTWTYGAVGCQSGQICCSTGAACPVNGQCPVANNRSENSACSLDVDCAPGLSCQDLGGGLNVCSPAARMPMVAAGNTSSYVLTEAGVLWAWGDNSSGQLGDGTSSQRPQPVLVMNGVAALAVGGQHVLALKTDGTIWAWGNSSSGQVGNGSTGGSVLQPIQVLSGVSKVAAGTSHSMAVKTDGTLWAWGENSLGQLGDGTTTNRTQPTQINLSAVASIGAGGDHSFAILSDRTLWGWGNNGSGELGDGTTTNRSQPVQVRGIAGLAAVTAGNFNTLGLKTDGTLWAWGNGLNGLNGDGTTLQRSQPVRIQSLSSVVSMAIRGSHALAAKADGTVWGWGSNSNGEVGDGTVTARVSPVQVTGVTGSVSIGAGTYHSISVSAGGVVSTWGLNSAGQLGNGGTSFAPEGIASPIDGSGYAWKVGAPQFSIAAGTYSVDQTVTVSSATTGSTIYYTLDGTTPTTASPTIAGPLSVSQTRTLRAFAAKAGLSSSDIVSAIYLMKVFAPLPTPGPATFTVSQQNVTLATTTSGAAIRYTLDGSTPTGASTMYTGAIPLTTQTTLKAVATRSGWTDSDLFSGTYVFNHGMLSAVTLSPPPGTFASSVSVSMSGPAGSVIRYTTDNTVPTSASAAYTGAVALSQSATVSAVAFKQDFTPSAVTSGTYLVLASGTVPAPVIAPAGGSYASSVSVTLSGQAGATLRYTLDGTDPSPTSPTYSSALVLTQTTMVKAAAYVGTSASAISVATYVIGAPSATMTASYVYDSSLRVTSANQGTAGYRSYGYDGRGNRTSETREDCAYSLTYARPGRPDQLTRVSSQCSSSLLAVDYDYDADGRVASKTWPVDSSGASSTAMAFASGLTDGMSLGALDSVYKALSVNGAVYSYFFDASNRRRLKVYPTGVSDEFFYDVNNQLLVDQGNDALVSPTNHPLDEYVWLDGRPVILIRSALSTSWGRQPDESGSCPRNSEATACGFYFPITDVIGKPVAMFDSSQRFTSVEEYDTFGLPGRRMVDSETSHPYASGTTTLLTAAAPIDRSSNPRLRSGLRVYLDVVDTNASDGVVLRDADTSAQLAGPWGGPHQGRIVTPWVEPSAGRATAAFSAIAAGGSKVGIVSSGYEYRIYQTGAQPFRAPVRFPGQYHDSETDLFQNWNRFYDPLIGRYLQSEPKLNRPRIGLVYGYAAQNPVVFADPDGLEIFVYHWVSETTGATYCSPSEFSADPYARTCINMYSVSPATECKRREDSCKFGFDVTLVYSQIVNYKDERAPSQRTSDKKANPSGRPDIPVRTHEFNHVDDINGWLDASTLNEQFKTEGFETREECNAARESVRGRLLLLKSQVERRTAGDRDLN